MSERLTEKYRPQMLSEVIGQPQVINRLRNILDRHRNERNLPNLLFVGPVGVGKTSTAQCIARARYGEEWKQYYREYNASHKLGVKRVRGEIVKFARFRGSRVIFLDECDSMEERAQEALRRDMETTKSTTFILSFNNPTKITEAIEDRCHRFDFQKLPEEAMLKRLIEICRSEGFFNTIFPADAREGLLALIRYANGSMRKVLNQLEGFITPRGLDYKSMLSLKRPEYIVREEV